MTVPVVLEPGGGEGAEIGTLRFTIKAGTEQTQGAYSLLEASGPVSATPHIHHAREEAFFILDGSAEFLAGEDRVEARPGSFLLVPRGTMHAFRCIGEGRLIIIHSPGGFERFFTDTLDAITRGDYDRDVRDQLADAYGMTYYDDVEF